MAKCYGSEVSADDKRLRERLIHQFSMTGLRRVAGQGRVGFRPSSEVQKFANGRWPARTGHIRVPNGHLIPAIRETCDESKTDRRCALQRGTPDSPSDFRVVCADIDFSSRRAHTAVRNVLSSNRLLPGAFWVERELNGQRGEDP